MLLAVLLLPVELSAQSRRDKEQTYVLDQPYEVTKITPPQGKKIKNVILMIGDGMSLMHVYSAWTANRGKLFLDNYGAEDKLSFCGCRYRRTSFEIIGRPGCC